jgi:hypothetical protein
VGTGYLACPTKRTGCYDIIVESLLHLLERSGPLESLHPMRSLGVNTQPDQSTNCPAARPDGHVRRERERRYGGRQLSNVGAKSVCLREEAKDVGLKV